MIKKLVNDCVLVGIVLSFLLTGFIVMGTNNVNALPATPTINPVVPDIRMDQDSEYYYDLSHHESDDNDVPVPPLISAITYDARAYYIQCDGAGGFGALTYLGDTGYGARSTCVGDFDNDGDYDVLTTHSNSAWDFYLYYYENVGTPTAASFGTWQYIDWCGSSFYQTGGYTNGMAPADYNNDGNLDFVINTHSLSSWLFLGDGNFGFSSQPLPRMDGNYGRGADAGDIDGDGDEDLVMANYPGHVYVYTNTDGYYSSTDLGDIGADIYGSVLADFNNDGDLDILVEWGSNGNTYLALGNGDGTFGTFNYVASADQNHHSCFDAYDFNDDGNQDIVLVDWNWNQVWFYPGNGDGTFAARQILGNTPNEVLGVGTPHKTIGAQGLTWSASDIDGGLIDSITFDAATDRMTITSQPGVWGSDDVLLTLTNTLAETTTQWITITIPEPSGPVIDPIVPDQTLYKTVNNLDLSKYENPGKDIVLSTPTTVADYQVKVVLNTGNFDYADAKINGADIRFFDVNDNPLSYWIESWNYDGTSTIWVKLPNVGTNQFAMKYGNPLATSESDGEATFNFFDDFNDGTIDPAKWPTQSLGGYIHESGGELIVRRADQNVYIHSAAYNAADLPLIFESKSRTGSAPGNGWSPVMWYQSNGEGSSLLDHANGNTQYVRNDWNWYGYGGKTLSAWHINRLTLPGTGTWTAGATWDTGENWEVSFGNSFSGNYYLKIGPRHDNLVNNQNMDGAVDWTRVRNYMATEPVATVRSGSSSLTWSVSDVDTTLFTANIIDVTNDILQFIPVNMMAGSDDILLTLTDSNGRTSEQWITVTVFPYELWIDPAVPDQIIDTQIKSIDLTMYENDVSQHSRDITLNAATTVADYQVKVVLNPGNFDYSHARPDGGDIRFYDANYISLSYYIDFWNVGGTSTIWVMIPDIGTSQFTMEYGDYRMLSESDGDATFPDFFDDFDTDTSGQYNIIGSTSTTFTWEPGNSRIRTSNNYDKFLASNTFVPSFNPIVEVKAYSTDNDGMGAMIQAGSVYYCTVMTSDYNGNNAVGGIESLVRYNSPPSDNYQGRTTINYGHQISAQNQWHIAGVGFDGTNIFSYFDGVKQGGSYNPPGTVSINMVGLSQQAAPTTYYDFLRVRKYVATEPVATIGAESGGYDLTWSVSDVDTTIFDANMLDVPNYILRFTWPVGQLIGGTDDILLTLTSSNGFTVQQWISVTVPDYPEIVTTVPFDGVSNIRIDKSVFIIFDQPMDLSTVTFTCTPDPGGWIVAGDQTTMVLIHSDFSPDTTYTFSIDSGTALNGLDLIDSSISKPNPWTFTTLPVEVEEDASSSSSGGDLISLDSSWTLLLGMASVGLIFFFFLFIVKRRKKEEEEE